MLKKMKKVISLCLVVVMAVSMSTTVFASENISTREVSTILENIIEYSAYNYHDDVWELDYAIVEDGILTSKQYNDAEEAGEYYSEIFSGGSSISDTPTTRALPAALVLVLKAIAAAGGAALVTAIVDDIYTYGMTAACENFSSIGAFNDFCKANGYI